jgi:hypothetical protein
MIYRSIVLYSPHRLLDTVEIAAPTRDLCPSGNSGLHAMPGHIIGHRQLEALAGGGCRQRMGARPTRDMVPASTLKSCGSSSRLCRRKKAPTRAQRLREDSLTVFSEEVRTILRARRLSIGSRLRRHRGTGRALAAASIGLYGGKKGQARFHNGLAGLLTYFDADAKGLLPASSCLARQAHSHAAVMPALKSKHRGTS